MIKHNKAILVRWRFIERAINDHLKQDYISSVPFLLMVIDGIVSDIAKTGFATPITDVEVWDSLVGQSNGLSKLKDIYNKSRKKTTTNEILFPYRNGILHGRDLSYDNEYVSCKLICLLFAVCDWVKAKETEVDRKEKFIEESIPTSFKELGNRLINIEEQKEIIKNWKPREIVLGESIPINGKSDEYIVGTPEYFLVDMKGVRNDKMTNW